MAMDRREFLGAGVGAALTGGAALSGAEAWGKSTATLPKRPWKDGIELSILAMGGIVVCKMPQEEASRRVAAAYERGVNYFDCAPSYFDGEAEMKLGEGLRPFRNKVFLAEKTQKRDAREARVELEQTLQRFHTDHVDLYQFHAVTTMDDVDKILGPGGAAELFFAAKKRRQGTSRGIFGAQRAVSDPIDGRAAVGQRDVSRECECLGKWRVWSANSGESEVERDGAHGAEGSGVWEMAGGHQGKRPQVSEMLV
jgi:hypothetical protein